MIVTLHRGLIFSTNDFATSVCLKEEKERMRISPFHHIEKSHEEKKQQQEQHKQLNQLISLEERLNLESSIPFDEKVSNVSVPIMLQYLSQVQLS